MAAATAGAALGAAAITGGSGLIGSLINAWSTSNNNKQQYVYNKKLAEQAYRQNIAQWNMENAYNSPAAQMARMRAAGLNPNMSFGQGVDVSSGNAGSSPQLAYGQWNPTAPQLDLSSPLKYASEYYLLQAQRDNLNSRTGLNQGKTMTEIERAQNLRLQRDQLYAQIEGTNLDNESKRIALKWADRMYEAELNVKQAEYALKSADKERIEYLVKEIMPAQLNLTNHEVMNYEKCWEKLEKEIDLLVSQRAKTDEEAALLKEQVTNYALDHMQRGFMGLGISIPNVERTVQGTVRKAKDAGGKAISWIRSKFKK